MMKSSTLLMLLFACIVPITGLLPIKSKPSRFCPMCCGPPPCCNYCGFYKGLTEKRDSQKLRAVRPGRGDKFIGRPCYNCYVCGPKPCCIQCPDGVLSSAGGRQFPGA
ncbi:uncharacterized protein LOC124280834 [Haliotis rubra]|uniref:uncharacterized protein LOC124280834 n=1 Tax=Haliotis rubra TaxID=36100 RepID=UPI001EE53772|nr:uncharacterized protein LOC124280834 [Haliotis rubra]